MSLLKKKFVSMSVLAAFVGCGSENESITGDDLDGNETSGEMIVEDDLHDISPWEDDFQESREYSDESVDDYSHDDTGEEDGGGHVEDYFPLGAGMKWVFGTSDGFTYVTEVIDQGNYEGRECFVVRSYTEGYPGESISYQYKEGDDMYLFVPGYSTDWVMAMDGPPEEGKRWSYSMAGYNYEFEWEFFGSISVPAGDFDNCYKAVNVAAPAANYAVHAPNVGSVYGVQGFQTMSLTSFSGG